MVQPLKGPPNYTVTKTLTREDIQVFSIVYWQIEREYWSVCYPWFQFTWNHMEISRLGVWCWPKVVIWKRENQTNILRLCIILEIQIPKQVFLAFCRQYSKTGASINTYLQIIFDFFPPHNWCRPTSQKTSVGKSLHSWLLNVDFWHFLLFDHFCLVNVFLH